MEQSQHFEEMQSKYALALSKYNTHLHDDEVRMKVDKLILNKLDENDNLEVKKQLLNCIDLTTLKCTDTEESVLKFTEKVNDLTDSYPDIPTIAAVCVYPALVPVTKATLETEGVNIAAVSACFPSSQTFIEAKVAEVALTAMAGANEIDVVISVGKFFSGFHTEVYDELREIKDACHGAHLKVILESGLLHNTKEIKQASLLAIAAGADFIKTSTGKTERSATLEAAYVMCQAIKEYYEKTGIKVGFKPAGGISTTKEAVEYYTIVRTVLGDEWMTNELFRFGASRLANNLLTSIYGTEVKYF